MLLILSGDGPCLTIKPMWSRRRNRHAAIS